MYELIASADPSHLDLEKYKLVNTRPLLDKYRSPDRASNTNVLCSLFCVYRDGQLNDVGGSADHQLYNVESPAVCQSYNVESPAVYQSYNFESPAVYQSYNIASHAV